MNKNTLVVLIHSIFLAGCSGSMPNLGINNSKLKPCPKTPNCVNSQATDEEHFLPPINFAGTQQEAHTFLLQVLESEEQAKVVAIQDNYIRAEFTSALFQFVDDVEFYVSQEQPAETLIHFRSASRLGYSDLGKNRKRMEQIRSKF